jgi:hypothetical protein
MAVISGVVECKGYTTPVQLKVSAGVTRSLGVLALETNTGIVYIGGKTEAGVEKSGFPMKAGSFLNPGSINDLGKIYIAGATGDKVAYISDTLGH